jgi:hypothetical protein
VAPKPSGSAQDLRNVLQQFREATLSAWGAYSFVKEVLSLIEALLLGPSKQIPSLLLDGCVDATREDEVSAIEVCFEDCLVAEISTRSRISHNVRLTKRVRFAVLKRQGIEDRMVVRVQGLQFPMLPEIRRLQRRVTESLGEDYLPESAYDWWETNKHSEFPLGSYKFHRIWESLWGMKALQMMPTSKKADAFWAYLHTVDLEVDALEAHPDRSVGARIAARSRYQADYAVYGRRCEECGGNVLKTERALGEKFARSAINFCALVHSLKAEQYGAEVKSISKLLSPAQWWGPGKSGWQQLDSTWNCTDTTTKTQGRLIWRLGGGSGSGTPSSRPPVCPMKSRSCYTSRMLATLFCVLLYFLLYRAYLTEHVSGFFAV